MTRTLHATFDGKVFRPEEDLSLTPNTRVIITIEISEEPPPQATSFLQTAGSLNLEGPPDWSARLDDYLYGNGAHADD